MTGLREVTADDLTDEMIHEHLDWLTAVYRSQPGNRRTIRDGIQHCAAALAPDGRRVVAVWWDAREKIATAINARNKETAVQRGTPATLARSGKDVSRE